jgi:hypothetical protein
LRCLFDTILELDKHKNDARLLGSKSKLYMVTKCVAAMRTFTWAIRHMAGSCQKHYIQTDMVVQKARFGVGMLCLVMWCAPCH